MDTNKTTETWTPLKPFDMMILLYLNPATSYQSKAPWQQIDDTSSDQNTKKIRDPFSPHFLSVGPGITNEQKQPASRKGRNLPGAKASESSVWERKMMPVNFMFATLVTYDVVGFVHLVSDNIFLTVRGQRKTIMFIHLLIWNNE